MKTNLLKVLIAILIATGINQTVLSQTCISDWHDVDVPYFATDFERDSYIKITSPTTNGMQDYMNEDFTLEYWVFPQWGVNEERYQFMSGYGRWDDDKNSFLVAFTSKDVSGWSIRVSDGNDDGGNRDLIWEFSKADYTNLFKNKWNHICVTFDSPSNGDTDGTVKLYVNGSHKKTQTGFDMLSYSSSSEYYGRQTYFYLGEGLGGESSSDHNESFYGYMSGFRLWNETLSSTEISYVRKKSFESEETFSSAYSGLFNKMIVNMRRSYNSPYNIYSTTSDALGIGMNEQDMNTNYNLYHPAYPPKVYNLTSSTTCEHNKLEWEKDNHGTAYVYRKISGASSYSFLCRTNSNNYTDTDIEPGTTYEYLVDNRWYNDDDPHNDDSGVYDSENEEITVTSKTYAQVQGFFVNDDASMGNCNGQVELKWDALDSTPASGYYLKAYINNSWIEIASDLISTEYIHNVSANDLGKTISYKIDGAGDGCTNYSDVISGSANEICTTVPTNVFIEPHNGSIKVTWDFTQVGAPATAFKLYRSIDGGSYDEHQTLDIDSREFIDNGSNDGAEMCKIYMYKVEAYNSCGASNSLSAASNDTVIPTQFDNVFDLNENAYFDASKGYYNNKIELEWQANSNKLSDIDFYEIYRKLNSGTYSLLTTINNANATSYSDATAEANIFYEYKIRAVGECSGATIISDSLLALGFRMNTGIVAGKITYEGGNSVENVEVRISTDEEVPSTSLKFDGLNDYMESDNFIDDSLFHNPLTIETWIKPGAMNSGQRNLIFTVQTGLFYIGITNMQPVVGINTHYWGSGYSEDAIARLTGDSILQENTWYHLAVTLNPDSGVVSLYLDGNLLNSIGYNNPQIPWGINEVGGANYSNYSAFIGGAGGGINTSMFTGNIEELRIWNTVRTSNEIQRNYTRLLTGKEDNLIGYYHFNEGFSNSAYDISKSDDFNKNDFTIADNNEVPEWSAQIPSFEQLHPAGITDVNGNYLVEGIQYPGSGGIFSVAPFLGVHEFNPRDINLFIGDSEPVHNGIDFTDMSAFRFTGTIYYSGTNFPVEGADVYVDNARLFDAGGRPIQTNEYGQIDISVPIGQHFVSVRKENHIFENNGQWPSPTANDEYPTFNFQDDVFNITFYDSTTVILAGRYVGGDVEGNKDLGLNKSVANIGLGNIVFKNEIGYDINTSDSVSSSIIITTNPNTGEYEIELLPEVYKIDSVWNNYYQMDGLDLGLLDLTNIPEITSLSDTTISEEEDTTIAEYEYHFKRNFIFYETPDIYVYGNEEEDLTGEPETIVQNPETEENDTINLQGNSPFLYDIYEMGSQYDISIYVRSNYYNYDGGDTITDIVPIEEAEVTIANNLEIGEPIHNFNTNADGLVNSYAWFRAGKPNMNEDGSDYEKSYTKTLTITANTQAGNVQWSGNEGNLYRAYVLGGVDAGGQTFVTYGPEVAEFVLHDPPGSNSYTYLEEGSGYTKTNSYSFASQSGTKFDNKLMYGTKFTVGGGLAGPVFSAESEQTFNLGMEKTSFVDKSGNFSESYKFTRRFQTSADPDAVGSMADVFIGKSYNMFFTETTNLRILPLGYCDNAGLNHLDTTVLNDTLYTLGQRNGFAVTEDSSSTTFMYSQDHIINTLIPDYKDLISDLLANSPTYESKIPASHDLYGTNNDMEIWNDTIAASGDTLPSYVFHGDSTMIDTIQFLNQQISIWIQTIALNEESKITADNLKENISFDGNIGSYSNETSYSSTTMERTDYQFKFKLFGGSQSGFNVNKFGIQLVSQDYKEWQRELGFEIEEERTMNFGYVIDDGDANDFYSVDVLLDDRGVSESDVHDYINNDNLEDFKNYHTRSGYLNTGVSMILLGIEKKLFSGISQIAGMVKTAVFAAAYLNEMGNYKSDFNRSHVEYGLCGSSPVFRIQGGQSSCPYEGPEETAFYVDTTNDEPYVIHQGTQMREGPKIDIDPQSVINVPEGEPAVFDLKLTNESATGHDFIYELLVDEASNPDGAILKIDGINPNHSFFIPAGQTLTKTLTVEQGAGGEQDYENLQLIFHSSCQYDPTDNFPDIADTVTFTARFIPTCTEVEFGNITDNWVVNTYNNNVLPINATGYNINQATFEKVYFQYQQAGATPTTVMTLFNDTTGYAAFTGAKMLVNGAADIDFDFNTGQLNDGEYTLFLTTICSDGSTYETEHLTGIIDRITPRQFGTPEPADGILSYGEDISVKFNEEINSGELYNFGQYGSESYISVRGITNGTDLIDSLTILHDASVHFDGQDDFMQINHINLDHSNFTIEFWAKRQSQGTRECVLSLGNFWAGFNANNNFVIEIDGQSVVSDSTYETLNQYAFYSIVYNRGDASINPQFTLFIMNDAGGTPQTQEMEFYSSLEGEMFVGFCPTDLSAFNGNIHEFRIWNYARLSTEISAQKGQILNGYEEGLYGLWAMNEAKGNIAKDIAFGRNATLNATWEVSRDGKALALTGANSFAIPAGSMSFSSQSDFTVEFWYKTATPIDTVTLLSSGNPNQEPNINSWNIYATNSQEIIISNNGSDVVIDAQNYLDNNWHHMAVTMNRIGYLSIYFDGNLIETSTVSQFEGFGAGKLVAGSRWYNLSMINYYDQYMTGVMDEIRVWNAARTQSQIQRYMNHTLVGDELGLKGYFPFEDVTIEDPSISNETSRNFTQDTIGVAGDSLIAAMYFTSESPNMKLQRPEVLIRHTLVINDDEVVITPNIEAAKIENQILDISIKRVKDMNFNEMASTLTWTAFVDKNQVVWDVQELNITKFVEEETVVTVNVRNNGGLNENYEITNIPTWMSVNPSSGSLTPLEVEEIEITINPELNIGAYQQDLNVVASMGYNERLALNINVNAHTPDWEVNPDDYEYSANIIGQLSVNSILSTDVNDIVACFANGECRGVANVEYFEDANLHLVFMNIYSNVLTNEQMTFKVFDASTGDIYAEVTPEITFEANTLYGSVNSPLPINSTNSIEQEIDLNAGWNWVSFFVHSENFDDLDATLFDMTVDSTDQIKAKNAYAQYSSDMWIGSLNEFTNKEMYKFKVATAQQFVITGQNIAPDTLEIPIVDGWNWIGYPLRSQTTISEALSSLTITDGDLLKSQQEFSVYNDVLGWIGSLDFMTPGKGYMLQSSVVDTLIYPSNIGGVRSLTNRNEDYAYNYNPTLYSGNMTVIAKVITDAIHITNEDKIYAFANGVCVGVGTVSEVNKEPLFFLTINGDATVSQLNFVLHNNENVYAIIENLDFANNLQKGDLIEPEPFTIDETTGIINIANNNICSVYPNPFTNQVTFQFNETPDANTTISIFNALGEQISIITNIQTNKITWSGIDNTGNSIASGVYTVRVVSGNSSQVFKICKTE